MKLEFTRFKELNFSNNLCDYHIHTVQTDGEATIEECVNYAINKGLKKIAFTEHIRKSSDWYRSFIQEIKKIRRKFKDKLTIFYGIEAKILDYKGNIDASDEIISDSEIVLGAVHRFPNKKKDLSKITIEDEAIIEFKLACAILKNPYVDVLAHPGGVFERKHNISFPKIFYEKIINLANQYNKAIEINSSYLTNPRIFFQLCKKFNPYVSLGSDAHKAMEIGNVIDLFNEEIKRRNNI